MLCRGTKELSLPVQQGSDRKLLQNTLLSLVNVLCRGWWALSRMETSFSRVLLSVTSEPSSVPTTEAALLTMPVLSVSSSAHHSIACTGDHTLVEHQLVFLQNRPQDTGMYNVLQIHRCTQEPGALIKTDRQCRHAICCGFVSLCAHWASHSVVLCLDVVISFATTN